MGNATSFLFFSMAITSAGTPEQLTQYFIPADLEVVIVARRSNTQNIHLANTPANALLTRSRKVLIPGQSTSMQVDDTSKIWFDSDNTNARLEVTVQRSPSTGG